MHREIYTFLSSEEENRWEKSLQNKAPLAIIETQVAFRDSFASKQHKEDPDMRTDPAEWRVGDLSVSSNSHLQHLTAAAASRPARDPEQSQAPCGVTRCRTDARGACLHQMTPEPEGSDGGEDR